jgi:multiple sugar transport system permease protein
MNENSIALPKLPYGEILALTGAAVILIAYFLLPWVNLDVDILPEDVAAAVDMTGEPETVSFTGAEVVKYGASFSGGETFFPIPSIIPYIAIIAGLLSLWGLAVPHHRRLTAPLTVTAGVMSLAYYTPYVIITTHRPVPVVIGAVVAFLGMIALVGQALVKRPLLDPRVRRFFQSLTTRGPKLWRQFWGRSNERVGYLFILPSLIHIVVFLLIPLAFSLYLSFTDWRGINIKTAPFIGLENYEFLISYKGGDKRFWAAMLNSAKYAIMAVPLGMGISLAIAVVMNQKLKGVYIYRTLFFMPVVSSWVAVAVVWVTLLDTNSGIINYLLDLAGIPPVNFLGEPVTALPTLVLIAIWKGAGFQMVIWLAGLQAVPEELYDAAKVDGASRWQSFWRITLPLLQPTTFFLLITGMIGSFQVFTPVYVMTQGGPRRATDVVVYRIYNRAFEDFDMGYASAQSWILFVVIFAVTLLQLYVNRKRGQEMLF